MSDLQSALVAAEPHPEALFLVTFQPTSAFFSVRALVANTNTTLNVVWQNQTYVLELEESSSPWLSVIFAVPVVPPSHPAPTNVSPAQPRDLIATVRCLPLQRGQAQTRLPGVEVFHPGTTKDHFNYAVRVAGVYCFIAENTLVFHLGVSNKTPAAIQYTPTNLLAMVDNAALSGTSQVLNSYAQQALEAIKRDGSYVRVPAGNPSFQIMAQPQSTRDLGFSSSGKGDKPRSWGRRYRDRIPASLDGRSCTGFVPSGLGRQKKTYRPEPTALR